MSIQSAYTPLSESEIERFISDVPGAETAELLGSIPGRWGRMPRLSRLVLVETGRILRCEKNGISGESERLCDAGKNVGLVGATRRGSLHTDLAFRQTMASGPGLASPALFGYTLPNTPLAEAAVVFGLTGPVYALFDENGTLLNRAEKEAAALLEHMASLDFMLACAFDHYPEKNGREKISVTLTVLNRDGDCNPCVPEMAENS
ncbi:hypothetical protein [Desulfopila sp. IMCC35008]|uniref:hypothetical protein n=1 Tax=Desulfopila sp. IMCC35008 TaxID=2653858 RepID=UPI0013D0571D|nr:hypothetical protein [Desulfopila sp. IMCC35008]